MEAMGVQDLTAYRQRVLWSAMVVSCLAHVWMLWAWRQHSVDTHWDQPEKPLAVRLLAPKMPTMPRELEIAPSQPPRRQIPVVMQNKNKPSGTSAPETVTAESPPPSAVAGQSHPLSTDDLIMAAKRDVGKIDRELRQAFPSRSAYPQKPASASAAALEKNIAAAGVPRDTSRQEMTTADGRRITKVVTPGGTYCTYGRKPGGSALYDAANEPMHVTGNCTQ